MGQLVYHTDVNKAFRYCIDKVVSIVLNIQVEMSYKTSITLKNIIYLKS